MADKASRFAFTEAKIGALAPPVNGRAWHYDSKVAGLCVCKTAAGGTSFYFYKWVNGRPSRMRLGGYPEMSVKQARDAAEAAIGQIAKGKDPQMSAASVGSSPPSGICSAIG